MQDGEYSPCNLLPLGIVPLILQDIISQFANELGTRHSQEAKKAFTLQWQQDRVAALLRAISIAMVNGAQISDYKSRLLDELPPTLFKTSSIVLTSAQTKPQIVHLEAPVTKIAKKALHVRPTKVCKKPRNSTADTTFDQFTCGGLTCSSLFTSKTNLRSSLMRRKGDICRRSVNLRKAIDCANSIETALGDNPDTFREFHNSINKLDDISVDDIVAAITQIAP